MPPITAQRSYQNPLMKNLSVQRLCVAGLLIAIGLIIPLFSPVKFVMDPVSFTLASHVPIFIAMFLSPGVTLGVAAGTALGFLISTTPLIAMRAATHVIFALAGAIALRRKPLWDRANGDIRLFSLLLGLLHGAAEVLVILPFYFGGTLQSGFYEQGFLQSVVVLIGVGTLVHSMIDFEIALAIIRAVARQPSVAALFGMKQ